MGVIFLRSDTADVTTLPQKKKFFLYLDFHGHSAKKNVFQYGNKLEALAYVKGQKSYSVAKDNPKTFPYFLSKQLDYFNLLDCSFNMPPMKAQTARIAMFHHLRIPFVFTLEASFCGANKG